MRTINVWQGELETDDPITREIVGVGGIVTGRTAESTAALREHLSDWGKGFRGPNSWEFVSFLSLTAIAGVCHPLVYR